jgi:hypothetical protein
MKKAWIENSAVRDVAQSDPATIYTPSVAVMYDTDVPDGTLNGATLVGGVWTNPPVAPPAPPPVSQKPDWSKAIDVAVIAVYDRPSTLSDEYKEREAEAIAYKAAGYTGTVPPRVDGFATPAGLTAQAATDLILSQAAKLRAALATLADLRMQKYAVLRASTESDAFTIYTQTMAGIAAIASSLG